ncbi:unnamed protein product [Euphydryas editha]|uniref:DUF7041 domain-containing protein n=1 Tax=Euphydryas editha TaxID=104508 RepID=A0AAU9UEX7_EUPED|nr:unnamed protein product [Euphydryas editha]
MDSTEERFAALQAQNLELQAMLKKLQQQQQQTVPDHTILSPLSVRYPQGVEDIVTQPPLKNKYLTLKAELIRRLSSSEEQRFRQLIDEKELGDWRPSQFLRHLRSLAEVTLSDENILRQLWMRRLPQHLQAILAAQAELSLEKVAEVADKILEVSLKTPAPHPGKYIPRRTFKSAWTSFQGR